MISDRIVAVAPLLMPATNPGTTLKCPFQATRTDETEP